MPSVAHSLRREWSRLADRAASLDLTVNRAVRTPVVAWYEREISNLRYVIERRPAATETASAALLPSSDDVLYAQFTFGVEIECFLPQRRYRGDLARAFTEAGVVCHAEDYNHTTRGSWKIVPDGSLGDYERGIEIVSPVLQGTEGVAQLRKVCGVLNQFGCTVRRSCGLHIHVGARGKDLAWFKNLMSTYIAVEDVVDTMTSQSRRGNSNVYCGTMRFTDISTVADINAIQRRLRQDRFKKLNMMAYWRHGTVEFRQHQGTVMFEKIEAWLKVVLRICRKADGGGVSEPVASLDAMGEVLGMTAPEVAYYQTRQAQLVRVANERR